MGRIDTPAAPPAPNASIEHPTSQIAAWIFAYEGLPDKVAVLLEGMNLGPTWGLVVFFVFLLLVGIFVEAAIPAMFILIPVMMPPVLALGIDPIHSSSCGDDADAWSSPRRSASVCSQRRRWRDAGARTSSGGRWRRWLS